MIKIEELKSLLKTKGKLVAMIAPAFPVMYSREELITQLRALGFQYVVEVSIGAVKTNGAIVKLLKENPTSRFITSPCASFVRFIRTKHPQYVNYLTLQTDSPMAATARIVKERYPGYGVVFIGPCITKKLEADEDYPELDITVLTFKELDQIVKENGPFTDLTNHKNTFDLVEKPTRIYPFDGGLTESSGIRSILREDEIRIVSGYKDCERVLEEFEKNTAIRFVDILFCEGGCINGPGIQSNLSTQERKRKVQQYSPT